MEKQTNKDYTVKDVLIYVRDEILPESYPYNAIREEEFLCHAIEHSRIIYKFGVKLIEKALSCLKEEYPTDDINSIFKLSEFWSSQYGSVWWSYIYDDIEFPKAMKEKRRFLTHIIDKL